LDISAFRREVGCRHGLPYGDLLAAVALGETFIIDLALTGCGVEMLAPGVEVYDKLPAIDGLFMAA
jgi:hypothetical protein